ncbi:hypothetical protein B0A61_00965 [Flavobacterium aquatile LMG 4008 = ATCC 11947]|uniref:Uncharacterized protein n=1 Tax=Flavobacterium aquatile LMG 4008 = ATCC 11947 TaxID=1453498 RepID=A0A095SW36_9FLAO|nr:hypothetical protein LG45_04395 [Flavobacterium aquatile LMG 4008 = ATCC 11947]OXA69409.1 hypothetical protein B0A61_00965 [Flavobacterium aquatile LMG 4008 = ATCC 11947]
MYKSSLYWNADDTDFTDLRRFILKINLEFYRKVLLKTIVLAQIATEILFIFSLKMKRLQCKAGNSFK